VFTYIVVVSTRERILDAAMGLFAQHGYKGTSITAIETAVGLTPGAGGIYRHFPSKQALLEAGVQRHLTRLGSLRDLRGIFGDLGDLRVELTMLARYALAELDREADLLRIVLTESRSQPDLLETAVEQLVDATWTGFANWIAERTGIDAEEALSIASVGLGALFSTRLLRLVLGRDALAVTDDAFVAKWVEMMLGQLGGSVV
jgi:AcrR family transcriptional regulator